MPNLAYIALSEKDVLKLALQGDEPLQPFFFTEPGAGKIQVLLKPVYCWDVCSCTCKQCAHG